MDNEENDKDKNGNRRWKNLTWYVFLVLLVILIVTTFTNGPKTLHEIEFSEFLNKVASGEIRSVEIRTSERFLVATGKDGQKVRSYYLEDPSLISSLREKGIAIKVDPSDSSWMVNLFVQALLPFILIALLWFFILRQAQGSNNQALSFGKIRAKPWLKNDKEKSTFKDVAGVDEAVEEVQEIVDFLKAPEKYHLLGAKIPRGVLLMGPPGTGKTLLARAIAGEADATFFSLSGSDFVEMFVGVGASRVRDLFRQAKKNLPSVVFIDEIDAVGRHRGAGLGGGHDEREQTLNQLLVEMDGFDNKASIIVIAATNRPDILDPALLRPGRFDRQVVVDKPDLKGRTDILKIHARGKKIAPDVDLELVARGSTGFTGADLANLLNEAALLAARRQKKQIEFSELQESIERVMAGPQRKSRVIAEKEKEIIAHHEVGHALLGYLLPNTDPVHKISMLPRGMALGYTLQLPVEDRFLMSREQMIDTIKVLMGGRIAEELIFGSITSGASNDIEKATQLVHRMVRHLGMSKLGFRTYGKEERNVFLGRDIMEHSKDYSDELAHEIDDEINRTLNECYVDGKRILLEHKTQLVLIAGVLRDQEVITSTELDALMKTGKLPEPVIEQPVSQILSVPDVMDQHIPEESHLGSGVRPLEPPLQGSRA